MCRERSTTWLNTLKASTDSIRLADRELKRLSNVYAGLTRFWQSTTAPLTGFVPQYVVKPSFVKRSIDSTDQARGSPSKMARLALQADGSATASIRARRLKEQQVRPCLECQKRRSKCERDGEGRCGQCERRNQDCLPGASGQRRDPWRSSAGSTLKLDDTAPPVQPGQDDQHFGTGLGHHIYPHQGGEQSSILVSNATLPSGHGRHEPVLDIAPSAGSSSIFDSADSIPHLATTSAKATSLGSESGFGSAYEEAHVGCLDSRALGFGAPATNDTLAVQGWRVIYIPWMVPSSCDPESLGWSLSRRWPCGLLMNNTAHDCWCSRILQQTHTSFDPGHTTMVSEPTWNTSHQDLLTQKSVIGNEDYVQGPPWATA